MIRKFSPKDIDVVLKIGFESFRDENKFIKLELVDEHLKMAKELLPVADIYIYEENGEILGSVAVVDNGYILGVHVDVSRQRKGIGSMLINYCKSRYKNLNADVFVRNNKSVKFFLKNDFKIVKEKNYLDFNEQEYEMSFSKNLS